MKMPGRSWTVLGHTFLADFQLDLQIEQLKQAHKIHPLRFKNATPHRPLRFVASRV